MGFSLSKIVQRIPQETRNFSNSVVRTGTAVGAAPFQLAGGIATQGLQAAVPVIGAAGQVAGAATGVLQQNPALAGALGSAFGIPGLGSLFGGGAPEPGGFAQQGGVQRPGAPPWVWLLGALGGLLALVLLIRK